MLRCAMCGRPAGDHPEAAARERAAEEQSKETHQLKKPVWICDICAGRARYEAEEGGAGLRRREKPPL